MQAEEAMIRTCLNGIRSHFATLVIVCLCPAWSILQSPAIGEVVAADLLSNPNPCVRTQGTGKRFDTR